MAREKAAPTKLEDLQNSRRPLGGPDASQRENRISDREFGRQHNLIFSVFPYPQSSHRICAEHARKIVQEPPEVSTVGRVGMQCLQATDGDDRRPAFPYRS